MPRELPHTLTGVPLTGARFGSRLRTLAGAVLIGVIGLNLVAQAAHADDLTDRRDQVNQKMAQTKRDLNESGSKLAAAATALEQSKAALSAAKEALVETRADLTAAKAIDRAMKAKLAAEQKKLKAAKLAVARGQKNLDAEKALAGEVARQQYQQRTQLAGVSILLTSESQADVETRMQWSTTMFDTSAAQMARLIKLQKKLKAAKTQQAGIEKTVAADRQAAADNVVRKRSLETAARNQASAIAALVVANTAAADNASVEVAQEKKQYSQLTAERGSVEERIAERIASTEAKAKAQAVAARQARESASRARATARQAVRAPQARMVVKASKQAYRKSVRVAAKRTPRDSGRLTYPVSSYITSNYGMRLHPVLKYWKLHDGTDFAASCGTPIRSAAAGVVTERYYNAGYGNRLLIDHGKVRGHYLTTGYNHAIRYTVGVGGRVSRGQVIGYAGTTGYSTGCHLHLMAWENGSLTNPMSLFGG